MVDHASEGGEEVMPTFQYSNPETIHWGPGILREKLDAELRRLGARRVFVVTTKSAVREPALAPRVEALLGDRLAGRFAGIGQHAPAHSVMEAVLAAREARADALLSIGGGSPIDAAKTVAFSLASGLDVTLPDVPARSRGVKLERTLPHLAVPTTLSVAELAGSAGFTAEGTKEKVGVAAPQLRPAAVFYDAELAVKTPLDLWLSTGIRAVDHGVETLLAPGEHPLPDAAALDGLRRLRRGLLAVKANPADLAARTECQLGAWHSYLLPGPAAKGLSHTLGKRLGSRHDIPHGVSSCLLLPHVMRYLASRAPETMKRIAEALEAPTAPEGVARLISQLGLPNHLAAYKLSDDDLREAVRPVANTEHSEKDLLGILRAAL
jgi:maleylacetate reductase